MERQKIKYICNFIKTHCYSFDECFSYIVKKAIEFKVPLCSMQDSEGSNFNKSSSKQALKTQNAISWDWLRSGLA